MQKYRSYSIRDSHLAISTQCSILTVLVLVLMTFPSWLLSNATDPEKKPSLCLKVLLFVHISKLRLCIWLERLTSSCRTNHLGVAAVTSHLKNKGSILWFERISYVLQSKNSYSTAVGVTHGRHMGVWMREEIRAETDSRRRDDLKHIYQLWSLCISAD